MATGRKGYSTDWPSREATETAVRKFEDQFAKEMGADVLVAGEQILPPEVFSTGSLALDAALGIGGLPCGRVIEMWGPEHAGKTSMACLAVAEAQRKFPSKRVAWVDMEQTFDRAWAKALGVDLSRLWLVPNPKTAEDVADATKRFVESGLCSLVVLDSVGGMISRKEFEKESEEKTVAAVAGIVTRMVKQCSPIGRSNGTTTLIINQVRANIGGYGATTQTSGGWALRHITTIKLKVQRGGSPPLTVRVQGTDLPVGHEVSVRVEKNKMAPYGKVAALWLINQETEKHGKVGVDRAEEALVFGLREGVISGKGTAWVTLPSGQRFNGNEKARTYLREHPEEVEEIREAVLASLMTFHEEEQEMSPLERMMREGVDEE